MATDLVSPAEPGAQIPRTGSRPNRARGLRTQIYCGVCSACGTAVCDEHRERCDLRAEAFCPSCLSFRQAQARRRAGCAQCILQVSHLDGARPLATALTNTRRPLQQFVGRHQIENLFWINLGTNGRGNSEIHKSKLRHAVRVCSERNTAAFFSGDGKQVGAQILPIGITIDFDRLVELCCEAENPRPVCGQTAAKVVNAPSRMTKYMN